MTWTETRARLALKRHSVASIRDVRARDKLPSRATRLKTAVCLGDLVEGIRSATRGWMAPVANSPKSRSKSSQNQAGCRARIALIE